MVSARAMIDTHTIKPGLHEFQLQVERSVTLVSSIVVEQRCCALKSSQQSRSITIEETNVMLLSSGS